MKQRSLHLAALVAAVAIALSGCASDGSGVSYPSLFASSVPRVSVTNRSNIPLRVTVWTAERVWEYERSWSEMKPVSERLDPRKRASFKLAEYATSADPVLRMQVSTRGPSFEASHTYWFELVTMPPMSIIIEGEPDRLDASSASGRVVVIPFSTIPEDRRYIDPAAPLSTPMK